MIGQPQRGSNGCGFLLIWAYLMFLSIWFAPIIAEIARNGVD